MALDPLKWSRQRQGQSLAFRTIGVQGYFGSEQPPLSEIPGSAPVVVLFIASTVSHLTHTLAKKTWKQKIDMKIKKKAKI